MLQFKDMEPNQTNEKADLNILVNEIDDIVTVTRQRVVELSQAMTKAETLLAAREARLKELQGQNEDLKKEIFSGGPSKEFVANLEAEMKNLRTEITEVRHILDSLGVFSKQFEDQLLALVDLDKKMTSTLVTYKFLRS